MCIRDRENVVHHEGGGAPGLDHQEGFRMILGRQDVEVEPFLRADLGDLLDVCGARGRNDGLAAQVVDGREVGGFLGDEAVRGHEMGDRKGHLLLALEVIGGRAAFEIDGAVRHQRDAGGGGHRIELDLELVELELGLHGVDDLPAQIHGIAHDLLAVVVIGERHRGFAVAERDRPGVLDLLERARELLRERRNRAHARCDGQRKQHPAPHVSSPVRLSPRHCGSCFR